MSQNGVLISLVGMSTFHDRRTAFRALHERGCFVIPNPWDVGSARYLQHLGFPALATTSAGFAFSQGLPDSSADFELSRERNLDYIADITAGVDLPEPPHRVSKLYWMAWDRAAFDGYERAIGGRLAAKVDGVERLATPWPDWLLNARVDARAHWRTVWEAVQCHASQVVNYAGFPTLSEAEHRELWTLVSELEGSIREVPLRVSEAQETGLMVVDLLRRHIDKENRILFPIAEKLLPSDVMTSVARKMEELLAAQERMTLRS